jgi:hypothetical protein
MTGLGAETRARRMSPDPRGPEVFLVARALNLGFFFVTAGYCILSYSAFAYRQFIRPEVLAWPSTFVALHARLFLLITLLTAWTLVPSTAGRLRSWNAIAYVVVSILTATCLTFFPVLDRVESDGFSLAAGLATLAFPLWLAAIDHLTVPPNASTLPSNRETLRTGLAAGLIVWLVYAVGAIYRMGRARGIDLDVPAFVVSWTASAAAHMAVFGTLALVLCALFEIASLSRHPGLVAYRLTLAMLTAVFALVLERVVFEALAFPSFTAWLVSIALAFTAVASWSGVARRMVAAERSPSRTSPDVLFSLAAPVSFIARRVTLPVAAILLALASSVSTDLLALWDWHFLLQKLTVVVAWAGAFALVHAMVSRRSATTLRRGWPPIRSAAVLMCAIVVVSVSPRASAWIADAGAPTEELLDRYAAIDPSFHFIRDTARTHPRKAAVFYTYLKAHSNIVDPAIRPVPIDFVLPLAPPRERPHVFLFVIDSLRRDYLSAYNRDVSFTPHIGAFATDSVVFERAFTRYSGTGLAVPSIWTGGMLLHAQYVQPFAPMNALAKLLDAGSYRRIMSVDSIASQLIPPAPGMIRLDRGVRNVDFEFCRTLRELESVLARTPRSEPLFVYTLPQDIHISNAYSPRGRQGVGPPGFAGPVAARVAAFDRCFGLFIAFLKSHGLYDDSVIVLTSDHGDSLGEGGRWGHSYTMYPEVIRIPLVVHVPHSLGSRVTADPQAVSFSADITPTLYALLGYTPRDLGPLYGRPLVGVDGEAPPVSARGKAPLLVASSYGAVWGLLQDGGRTLFVADGVEGRDYAYDLGGSRDVRLTITDAMRETSWRQIEHQVGRLAAAYGYQPEP